MREEDDYLERFIAAWVFFQHGLKGANGIGHVAPLNVYLADAEERRVELWIQFGGEGVEAKGFVKVVLRVIDFGQVKATLCFDLVSQGVVVGIQSQGFRLE